MSVSDAGLEKTHSSRYYTTRRALFRLCVLESSRVFLRRIAGFEIMRVVSNETARASRTATVLSSLFRRERAAFGKRKPTRAPPAAPVVVETPLFGASVS